MSKIEESVEKLVTDPINKLGYRLYDVMYVKEGKDNYLRIFIDNDKGISLGDCEKVNNAITNMLDEANYIKEQYYLEVSSPGVERHIRKDSHLKSNIREEIFVKTFISIPETNSKELTGILKQFDENTITVESEGKDIKIERKNITLIKKVYNW